MANTSIMATAFAVGLAMSIVSNSALAGGSHSDGHSNGSIGSAGDAGHVDREIMIEMGEMFFPLQISKFKRAKLSDSRSKTLANLSMNSTSRQRQCI